MKTNFKIKQNKRLSVHHILGRERYVQYITKGVEAN
jgi:hypothetical protein